MFFNPSFSKISNFTCVSLTGIPKAIEEIWFLQNSWSSAEPFLTLPVKLSVWAQTEYQELKIVSRPEKAFNLNAFSGLLIILKLLTVFVNPKQILKPMFQLTTSRNDNFIVHLSCVASIFQLLKPCWCQKSKNVMVVPRIRPKKLHSSSFHPTTFSPHPSIFAILNPNCSQESFETFSSQEIFEICMDEIHGWTFEFLHNFRKLLQKSAKFSNVLAKLEKFRRRIRWLQQRPETQLKLNLHDFDASGAN